MNFSITIYPFEWIPCSKTWGEVKEDFIKISDGLYQKDIGFDLIDNNEDHARLIIQDLYKLKISEPSQIIKTVEIEQKNIENQFEEFEKKVSIRCVYDRRIEFFDLDKLVSWNMDFGINGLYAINE